MSVKYFATALVALTISLTAPVFAAEDASMHQVYLAAEAGQFNEAQSMMDKVLHDHPNSAKAHYVEAELLAKQGKITGAQNELNTAERLQPGLSFVKPQALEKLKARLSLSTPTAQSMNNHDSQPANNDGTPWGMIFLMVGLIAFIYLVAKWMTSRNPPQMQAGNYPINPINPNTNPQQFGSTSSPMMGQSTGGMGSGIMGSLATGAALGAGMVAGEALMHHFTDGDRSNNGFINEAHANNNVSNNTLNQDDMGGSDFGIADNSSWDDNSSGGGDDWV